MYYFGFIVYTFIPFSSLKTSTLEFLAEINKLSAYYRNSISYKWQNYLAFLIYIAGVLSN